ncbi:Ribonuclease e inhibitor rraa dimethylmenaquinone methyltransferase [Scedosporium apiospermum]|uniref:Ribonuclease e inhibitor rraa dimethylmenaquinone methyltransferase n=1 Tax=Pseudallescheria apiosperma TaxID=563466 RepID=A0A084FV49_PSEDA|nr:Ribonuclease e inhibitor rraa dimethylmenaquinone methyltransferase [Scedosporium apiospermum]KEZ38961.1 Ribonuclease e inhibitor rraa dimethylmenaquinone methyltransferase [Scedosporium apiospermum]
MASSNVLKRLAEFATCDIGDALVKLKHPYGGFLEGITMWSPERRAGSAKIFGPAVTVKMVLASDTAAPTPARHFVDCNEKGKVMFVQQPKGLYSACWGGLMSTRAKVLGAAGVIIDGKFRDIGEHRELGFPLFAREMSILGSNTFTKASEINVPLQFKGDLWINPDDLVVGDADGVVVVPPSLAEKVVALCEERAEIDKKTIEALLNGAEMGPTIKQLRKQ